MKRIGFLLKVKQDKIEAYKKHHKAVWPEMLEALRRTGWHNYSLFLRDDGTLFGYFETPHSFEAALEGMAGEEINAKWQDFMAPYFESPAGTHADTMMVALEEVFHLD
ncbi:L-rhamnose mutarotase [Candidatus Leptofilum sp.]|uniref:L-rhamnose mutarotase n=1 Tax=Candidatus Leptofilum sp. TaxID=3241576 RepID=UPI003B5CB3BD